jgi:putative hemolysin
MLCLSIHHSEGFIWCLTKGALVWNKILTGFVTGLLDKCLIAAEIFKEIDPLEFLMKRKLFVIGCLLLAIALLSACRRDPGLANPASVFCEENGGTLEIREEAEGQVGVCVFPDGSECEEWAYYRGECAPGEN